MLPLQSLHIFVFYLNKDMHEIFHLLSPSYPHHSSHHTHNPMTGRSGQILWIRGLTRLQTQVGHEITLRTHPPCGKGLFYATYSW